MTVNEPPKIKSLVWIGSSRRDLKSFPAEVKDVMGYALYQAQVESKARSAKPLAGFGRAGVLEIVEDHQTDTYRAVYTVKFFRLGTGATCLPEEIEERHRHTKIRN